jgi:thiamine biosynthesis lipoprotein
MNRKMKETPVTGGLRPAGESAPPSAVPRRRFLRWLAAVGAAGFTFPLDGVFGKAFGAAPGGVSGGVSGGVAGRPAFPETARAWRAMGTLIEVRVPDLPVADAVEAIRGVRRRVEALEAAMTLFRPESPLVAFNRSAPGRWMDVPEDLARGVAAAVDAFAASGGAFDPTVTPAVRAWGLYDLEGRIPPPAFFRRWAARPRGEAVEVDVANRRLRRCDPRTEVDLGGVGKGIAVDAALSVLRAAGSRSALVNLGGSIGVLGPPPWDAAGWPVGIADPARPGSVCGTFSLAAGHVATSGVTERWVDTAAGRKHHLLDPATGEPTSGVEAVTVRCARGVEADLQSTVELIARARGGAGATVPALFPRGVVMVSRSGRVAFTPDA